jgi:long-chain fatty acid transport protein
MQRVIPFLMLFTVIVSCLGFAESVFAGGFDNATIGIKAISMGALPVGIADDASAVYFNPGGMVFNENKALYAEIYGYYAPTKFEYTADSHTDKSDEVFIIPGFFIAKRFDNWAFGFGSYIPYAGGGTAYDNFQDTGFDLESFAGWFAFTPAVAYKLSDSLSIGVALSAYIGEMEGEKNGVKSEYDGFAGYGGHLGLLYKISEELSVGFTARSEVPIEMDGSIKFDGNKFDSDVELTLPYSFTLGFGYKPAQNFTIGLSVSYALYNHMDEIIIKAEEPIGRREEPTGYDNNWFLGLGMEYRTESRFVFRGGLTYDRGVTRGKWLDEKTNDVQKWTPRIGVGYDITESIEMNIAGLIVFGVEEEYNSKKYDQDNFSISVGFRFKYR